MKKLISEIPAVRGERLEFRPLTFTIEMKDEEMPQAFCDALERNL